MKCISFLLLVLLTFRLAAAQMQNDSFAAKTRDEKELVRLTRLMSFSSGTGNSSAYDRYIDKDFLITYSRCTENSFGNFADKAKIIEQWTKMDTSAHSHSIPHVYRVQISGNTAVVHSYIVDDWLSKEGKKITAASWATDVWVKRKKQWYWISSHESILL